MDRIPTSPRPDLEREFLREGLSHRGVSSLRWAEDRTYLLSANEIDALRRATALLDSMLREALDFIVREDLLEVLGIPACFRSAISDSWNRREPPLIMKFDVLETDEGLKLVGCDSATPLSLIETGPIQARWRRSLHPRVSQLNRLESDLTSRIGDLLSGTTTHFFLSNSDGDEYSLLEYLRQLAIGEGIRTKTVMAEDIRWCGKRLKFVENRTDAPISAVIQSHPDQFPFSEHDDGSSSAGVQHLEPRWKILLRSRAILAILWELFPSSPLLVPAFLDRPKGFVGVPFVCKTVTANSEQVFFHRQVSPISHQGWFPNLGLWSNQGELTALGISELHEKDSHGRPVNVPHLHQ